MHYKKQKQILNSHHYLIYGTPFIFFHSKVTLHLFFPSSLAGRFHMRIQSFLKSKIVTSKEAFLKACDSPDFFDFLEIGQNSSIILCDGMTVTNTNITGVSARIYATSKAILWRSYYFICASFALNASLNSRLILTGTS